MFICDMICIALSSVTHHPGVFDRFESHVGLEHDTHKKVREIESKEANAKLNEHGRKSCECHEWRAN